MYGKVYWWDLFKTNRKNHALKGLKLIWIVDFLINRFNLYVSKFNILIIFFQNQLNLVTEKNRDSDRISKLEEQLRSLTVSSNTRFVFFQSLGRKKLYKVKFIYTVKLTLFLESLSQNSRGRVISNLLNVLSTMYMVSMYFVFATNFHYAWKSWTF